MKEYYLLENGIRKGPYDINDLKEKNISPDTQIWVDINNLPCFAIDIAELGSFFKEQQLSKNKITDDFEVFGYKPATNEERAKRSKSYTIFTVTIVVFYFFVSDHFFKGTNFQYFIIGGLALLYYLYLIFYFIPKHSATIEQKYAGLKLISAKNGKDIGQLFKENKSEALKIILKYLIPSYYYTTRGKAQTWSERLAGLYLVKIKN